MITAGAMRAHREEMLHGPVGAKEKARVRRIETVRRAVSQLRLPGRRRAGLIRAHIREADELISRAREGDVTFNLRYRGLRDQVIYYRLREHQLRSNRGLAYARVQIKSAYGHQGLRCHVRVYFMPFLPKPFADVDTYIRPAQYRPKRSVRGRRENRG